MYNKFFGLQRNPFNLTPDPGFLFLTAQHREALAGLTYAILGRKGFVVLTGGPGTGKTTLLMRVLEYLPKDRLRSSVILNTTLSPTEFLETALLNFGITDIPASKAQRLLKLQAMLMECHRAGKVCALVVDEAHKLSPEVLEEIRLLSNFEKADEKLLQIVIVGQEELVDVLNRTDLWQLKQRIAVRFSIASLSLPDVDRYIRHRWGKAGGSAAIPFNAEAISAVAQWSQGIPRVMNAICDNTLMLAFSNGTKSADAKLVLEASIDLDLIRRPGQAAVADPSALKKIGGFRESSIKTEAATDRKPSFLTRWVARVGLA
jgi:general secretion pathway protein A